MTISKTEALIAARIALGEVAALGGGDAGPTVDAGFLRRLLLGLPFPAADHEAVADQHPGYPIPAGEAPVPIAAPGLRISGAIIRGVLDLSDCIGHGGQGLPALALEHCRLEGDGGVDPDAVDVRLSLDVSHARLARLSLRGSQAGFIRGREVSIDGPLDLGGLAPLNEAAPTSPTDDDLSTVRAWFDRVAEAARAEPASVREGKGALFHDTEPLPGLISLAAWPSASGDHCWLDLTGARIAGRITLDDARLRAPAPRDPAMVARVGPRFALGLMEAEVGGGCVALGPCSIAGGIDLVSARIQGELNLRGSRVSEGEGPALSARNASIVGGIILDRALLTGSTDLNDARLGANLDLRGTGLNGRGKIAVTARNTRIEGDIVLTDGACILGSISLHGASANFLHLSRARLAGDTTLVARHARFDQIELLGDCVLIGGASFVNAEVRSDIIVTHAIVLGNRGQAALDLEGVRIGANLGLHDQVVLNRALNLKSVTTGDQMLLQDVTLIGGGVIAANGVKVGSSLRLRKLHGATALDLSDASCAILDDDPSAYGSGRLDLNGLTYQRLARASFTGRCVDDRAAWLSGFRPETDRETAISPQPYHHLARVLAGQGQVDDARDIQVLLADRRRAAGQPLIWSEGWLTGLGRWTLHLSTGLFGKLFGYGLKPTRAVTTLAVALVAGWAFFGWANWRGAMVIDQQAVASIAQAGRVGAPAPTDDEMVQNIPCGDAVRPSLYALDVFIPLVDLLQETECEIGEAEGTARAMPLFQGITIGSGEAARTLFGEIEVYRFAKAFYALAGWLILSLSILTFSGVMQRSGETG